MPSYHSSVITPTCFDPISLSLFIQHDHKLQILSQFKSFLVNSHLGLHIHLFFMEKEYFLNAGITPPFPAWQSLSSTSELNCSSEQSSDCFVNASWEKSMDQYAHFESSLSSMVSSPAASNSALSSDGFAIRELIGKLGNICNSGEISQQSHPLLTATVTASYINGGNNSANTSCYGTPLNSPPKMDLPTLDPFVKENLHSLGNSMPRNPTITALSADPGFAERAAKFSCFGSRSFNGRTSQLGLKNTDVTYRSIPLMAAAKLPRVSSTPSLKAAGSPTGVQENKNSAGTQMEMRSANGSISGVDKKFSKLSGYATSDRTEFASSNEESSVSEQIPSGETGLKTPKDMSSRKRKAGSRGKVKETSSSQPANATKVTQAEDDSNSKRSKLSEGNGNENGGVKTEEETKGSNNGGGNDDQKQAKSNPKPPEPPKDYIHVRARRGQATDSHSLAERVRREKISERMKLLQDLVPSCNKVTGKALMLDEIINYVQSLQRQVEFLAMKLASVNPRLDFNMDTLLSKDILQPNGSLPQPIYPLESSASAFYGHQPRQSPQVHTNVSTGAVTQCSADPLDTTLCQNIGMQLPPFDEFGQGLPQFLTFCEDDLQSLVQMGFGQNPPNHNTAFHSESFPDSNQTSHMKIEL
ncbi:hypothetical protein F0562_002252 [Nyssa sinensis]|uniref:BHLH domain-containing protein n=1 Tax=Nyssa sinensis TaxID=561372 RepID=A0A5J5C5J1_9ASTE|nr:hypothetical protein F0562_002252 [Nyssa sinensis]